MNEINRITIPTSGREIRSLCWHNNELIDWVSGGIRYRMDGSQSDPHINWTYRFDKAVTSDDGRSRVYAYNPVSRRNIRKRPDQSWRQK